MPRGPKGEKRPADVIGNAVHVMRIATGGESETLKPENAAAVARGKSGWLKGGLARQLGGVCAIIPHTFRDLV